MKRRAWMLATAVAAGLGVQATAVRGHGGYDDGDDDHWLRERDTEEIRRTFAAGARPLRLEVDNLDGSIRVVGRDVQQVQLVAHRTNRARSPEKLLQAKSDVRLDDAEETGLIHVYVDAPQRGPDGSVHDRGSRYYGYRVRIDFELEVPRDTELFLRTVNDGDISVTGVRGAYDVENVNGGIVMQQVAGAGRVYALNGEVQVTFERNPKGKSYFGSLNGDIEVAFLHDLAAELEFKTFNGEVYSDFEVTRAASGQPVSERRGHHTVYRTANTFGVQVGGGGPRLEFDAFNGDIRILKRDE